MNEIKSEIAGTIVEVVAENGKPVQYRPGALPGEVTRLPMPSHRARRAPLPHV